MEKNYIVFTDGGCERNPSGKGGYGVVIIDPEGHEKYLMQGYRSTTNNRMEIMAAIAGLKNIPEPSVIHIYSDSQYVVKTMTGEFSKKKNKDLWDILTKENYRHTNVTWHWIKGHDNNRLNELCDKLATQAMDGELIEDVGYEGEQTGLNERQLKLQDIGSFENITADAGKYMESNETIQEEAKRRGCKETCIVSIRKFYDKDTHTFQDYGKLKTGGTDFLSTLKKKEDLVGLVGAPLYQYLQKNLQTEREVYSAIRWIARGLLPTDAIKKVKHDSFYNGIY